MDKSLAIAIAITGITGCGKSTLCRELAKKGFPVYYSDDRAKLLANTNGSIMKKVIDTFGQQSYCDGKYNTKYIRSLVINDSKNLEKLNLIFRSHLDEDFEIFKKIHKNKKYIFYESALVFQHKIENKFDYIVGLKVNYFTLIHRIAKRDHLTYDQAKERLNMNFLVGELKTPDELYSKCDLCINTSTNCDEVLSKLNSWQEHMKQ